MKSLIFVTILILNVFIAYSATEPVIKIYMNDGSPKQYNINDIADLSFFRTNLSYSMTIFQSKGNSKIDIDIRTIDSIEFENNKTMKIVQSGITKMIFISQIDSIIFTFNTCTEIQIGDQIWMCKNLDVDHYRNGDSIPEVRDVTQWTNLTTGAWCYFSNDTANGAIYGKLYNWHAVNDPRGLAPSGWHIPTDAEWGIISKYLGGGNYAGDKMREIGTVHWLSPNNGATNSSGFTGLPGNECSINGYFPTSAIGMWGYWWTSTVYSDLDAYARILTYKDPGLYRNYEGKVKGFSVRCVKDK